MLRLAITGNIACGKNLVGEILRESNIAVIDVDETVREILRFENEYSLQVARLIPSAVLEGEERDRYGFVNRKEISKKIFACLELKREMESILHPGVYAETKRFFGSAEARGEALAACLIPLLFETNTQSRYSQIWLVYCLPDLQRQRLASRNPSLSEEELTLRIDSQLPQEQKIPLSDCVIDNSGSRGETEEQVLACLKQSLA